MNKTITISAGVLIALAVSCVIGYFLGRSSVVLPETKVERIITWSKGETITKYVDKPVPYAVRDTAYKYIPVPEHTDTAALFAVWRDYYLERDYCLDFSDDSIGVFKVDLSVKENKIAKSRSTINPYIRTIREKETIYKVPTIQFYGIVGTSLDLKTNQIQLGVDLKQRYLIGVSGIRMDDEFGYTLNVGIKF